MFFRYFLMGFFSLSFWIANSHANQLEQYKNFENTLINIPRVSPKKTICLNMIVKNESSVICRCLASIKPYIDYWVIVDTGSSDNTQYIIKEFMKDIPGDLHERPWVNFAHNRNQALEFAKGKADYILIIDADETLAFDPDFKLPLLDKDFYYITTEFGGTKYGRVQLVNNHLDWRWEGVLHEVIHTSTAKTSDSLVGVKNVVRSDGARSQDPRKYHKDAEVLEKALLEDPNNSRYQFYLAQSYRDAGEHEKALKNYEKRIAMGGWDQELYWSKLQVARLQEALKMPPEVVIEGYYNAFNYRPSRSEPLYGLATYYRNQGKFAEGYNVAKRGLMLPAATDILFVEKWIDDWGMLLEYSISAYWIENYIEALLSSKLMLANPTIPQGVRECVERNMVWVNSKLAEFQKNDLDSKSIKPIKKDEPTLSSALALP